MVRADRSSGRGGRVALHVYDEFIFLNQEWMFTLSVTSYQNVWSEMNRIFVLHPSSFC